MWICIVTIFPDVVNTVAAAGVLGRTIEAQNVELEVLNPRDFATDPHRSVDDRPFGGGPGMVLKAEPLAACLKLAKARAPSAAVETVYLSPQGRRFTQAVAREYVDRDALILICGRYEGIDERFLRTYIDAELSIGDYILSGGELPALVVLESVSRLIDGTLGNPRSAEVESHHNGLLDHPQYTKPRLFEDQEVPELLRSGHHDAIAKWRHRQALAKTYQVRPDLLLQHEWTPEDLKWLAEKRAKTRKNV